MKREILKLKKMTAKYIVLDNKRPAKYPIHTVNPSLKKNEYNNLDEALEYTDRWLGKYSPGIKDLENFAINMPFEYNDSGDVIEIKEKNW